MPVLRNSSASRAIPISPCRGEQITGYTNNNGNDGTIARFGWKAQNQTLPLFSGEAYNVEMGITNELFQQEREQDSNCQFAQSSQRCHRHRVHDHAGGLNAIEKFAFFQRFPAPPTPSPNTPGGATSIDNGRASSRAPVARFVTHRR